MKRTLGFDGRPPAATGTPDRADDHVPVVEGVVDMAGHPAKVNASETRNVLVRLRCASSREERHDPDGLFELGCEDLRMDTVLKPPDLLALDLPVRGGRESDAALVHRDRSSLRISSTSTNRPAATSLLDSRRALWSAARSASSSQSPGSSGRRSTSVPSGRSVGSSTTSRPALTRALIVMPNRVALEEPPNTALHPTGRADISGLLVASSCAVRG